MRHLKPLGKPVARVARLPAETAVCFLAAVGSMIAAHTMAAQFHGDARLDDHLYIQPGFRDQLHVNPFNPKQHQRL